MEQIGPRDMDIDTLTADRAVVVGGAQTSRRWLFWRKIVRRWSTVFGLLFILLLVVVSLFPGLFASGDPASTDFSAVLVGPGSPHHFLGTDSLGGDVYTRLIYGTRVTFGSALLAVVVATVIGVPFGLLAGYYGGRLDAFLQAATDGMMSVPAIIIVIAVMAALGGGIDKAMIAVGVVFAARVFRVQRASTVSTKAETFIEASHSIGCRPRRTIWVHVLPNTISALIVQLSLLLGAAVVIEAGLDFIGLGIQPPEVSWGTLLADAKKNLSTQPFMVVPAGIALTLTVIAFALAGEGVSDAISGKSPKGRR